MARNLQGWHIVVLVVVILLLFGANRLPGLARSVGQSLRIFKREMKDLQADDATTPAAPVPPASPSTAPAAPPAPSPSPQADQPSSAERPSEGGSSTVS